MFGKDTEIQQELARLGLPNLVDKYYDRFAILYKLRSEHLDRLANALRKKLKAIKNPIIQRPPPKYLDIPTEGQSKELITLIELRNAIKNNPNSLYKRIDIKGVIETFDYYLALILPIDKTIEKNKELLKPIRAKIKVKELTSYSPSVVEHIMALDLQEEGSPAAITIFKTFLISKKFVQGVNNYVKSREDVLLDAVLKGAVENKTGKIQPRDRYGKFKSSKNNFEKLNSKFKTAISSLVNYVKPKTIELVGLETYTEEVPEFFSILQLINSKLKMAIISNMGKPSLVNRTGRFASSARITRVTMTDKNTINLSYSYQQNPYSVFEQEVGKAPWNSIPERDPKTIIEKSLRQLAQEAAFEKLGLKVSFNREF